MVEPVRHRQTKGAATDMFGLQPPRHTSTLPITSLTALQQFFRSWGHSGHDTNTVARRGPPRASPSCGWRTHPRLDKNSTVPAKGGTGEASAKSRRVAKLTSCADARYRPTGKQRSEFGQRVDWIGTAHHSVPEPANTITIWVAWA